jgi:hypothetical protein
MTATPLSWAAWCATRAVDAHHVVATLGAMGLPTTLVRAPVESVSPSPRCIWCEQPIASGDLTETPTGEPIHAQPCVAEYHRCVRHLPIGGVGGAQ